jgi:hypothetical protein
MLKLAVIKIRRLMLGKSVTGVEIAKECGVCRSYVSHVIAGRVHSPRIRGVIASRLGSDVEELWPDATNL